MKFIHESSLGSIFKIKGIFDFLFMDFPNEKFDKKKFYDVIQLFINELIYYNFNSVKRINQIFIKNKDTNNNSSKTLNIHNSINRNNSIEQQVNYDKLLKKKRKESIDCKKINSFNLDNEINDVILKEKESDDEINVPEVNDDYINEEISKKENLEFFNKDISLLEESYNYLTIPKEQIMTFKR